MGKELTIVALYPEISAISGDVWTLNDWYSRHPDLKPDRVFQLHRRQKLEGDIPGRMLDDWKKKYVDSGAEIIMLEEVKDLPSTILELDGLKKNFKESDLSCSISMMIGVAILEGYESIRLTGLHLMGAEFIQYIHGVLNMINEARLRGVIVEADYEQQWIENEARLDWSKHEVATVPYWEVE